jgi:Na+-transporting methylmalonyl-CoA/oxaloacetate decarboxylase gamma subunit
MSRRYVFLFISLTVIAASAAVLRVFVSGMKDPVGRPTTSTEVVAPVTPELSTVVPATAAAVASAPVPVTPSAIVSDPALTAVAGDTEKHTSTVPLPELMPTTELTGGSIGNQRVSAMEAVGDVYRLAWHEPTKTLFMTVTEKDRMRAIWKLGQDGTAKRVMEFNRLDGDFNVSVLKSGTLLAQFENPGRAYRSADAGETWVPVLYDSAMCWNFTDDGQGTVYGGVHAVNAAVLLRSLDDGVTWEEWKNFQTLFPEEAVTYAAGDARFKLRHLHDVTLIGNRILVGVGDVFRATFLSEDGGATWKKIWYEGFTAHAADAYESKVVFAPDTLRRNGVGLFDTVTGAMRETWRPGDFGYSGYSYSVLNKNGVFYVAFHTEANEVTAVAPKFGVIASLDGYRWYRFLEYGPFTNTATTMLYLADGGDRVFLSVNGSLYGFKPLDADWFAFKKPFGVEK